MKNEKRFLRLELKKRKHSKAKIERPELTPIGRTQTVYTNDS